MRPRDDSCNRLEQNSDLFNWFRSANPTTPLSRHWSAIMSPVQHRTHTNVHALWAPRSRKAKQSQVHDLIHISSCLIYPPSPFLSWFFSPSTLGEVTFISSDPQAASWSCEKQLRTSWLCVFGSGVQLIFTPVYACRCRPVVYCITQCSYVHAANELSPHL